MVNREFFFKIVILNLRLNFLLKILPTQVLEFIRLSLRSHRVNLLAVDCKNGTNLTNSFAIPVDETVQELTISLTGKKILVSVSHSSEEKLNGSVRSILNLENVKVISIQVNTGILGN